MKSNNGLALVVAFAVCVLPFLSCTNADVEFTGVSSAGTAHAGKSSGSAGIVVAGDAGAGAGGEAGEGGAEASSGAGGSSHGGLPNAGGAQGANAGRGDDGAGGSGGRGGDSAGGSGGRGGVGGSAGRGAGGTGGASAGGANTGGASTGGANTGGASTGGANTGGASTGGASTGGASTGGAGVAGSAGASAVCGNQRLENGEQCDDGNSKNLDGCDASCGFEQSQRANFIEFSFTTSSFCPRNAFGAALAAAGQSGLQALLSRRVESGSLSLLFGFRGLTDLSGTSAESISLGVAYGTPSVAPNYDGRSDLDWWYTPAAGQVDSSGVLYSNSTASLVSGVLNATPGNIQLPLLSEVPLSLSSTQVRLNLGQSSAPLSSSGSAPGHLASERVRPGLVSFASAGPPPGNDDPGQLCANLSAASLAAVAIPAGASRCREGYAATRSFLDLLVDGCTIDGNSVVPATQPDQADPGAPQGRAGAPYRLITNASHSVTGCRDQNNAFVNLTTCLNAAAYSSAYRLRTGRVIIK